MTNKEKSWFERNWGWILALGIVLIFVLVGSIVGDPESGESLPAENQESPGSGSGSAPNNDSSNEDYNELGDSDSNSGEEVSTYEFGESINIGGFEYVFEDYRTTSSVGGEFVSEDADGVFFVLDVRIENVGNEPKYFSSDYVKIVDSEGRTFTTDTDGMVYVDDSVTFEEMQPGLEKEGKLVYDIPEDVKGHLRVEDDSTFSDDFVRVSWN